jgi:hypothetical protein
MDLTPTSATVRSSIAGLLRSVTARTARDLRRCSLDLVSAASARSQHASSRRLAVGGYIVFLLDKFSAK